MSRRSNHGLGQREDEGLLDFSGKPTPQYPTGYPTEWLKAREAAKFLGVNIFTLYKLAETGQIPHVKRPGVGLRFRRDHLEAWLMEGLRGGRR